MKNTTIKIGIIRSTFLFMFAILSVSCESDFDTDNVGFDEGPPEITSVSEAREDVAVTQGVLENTYIIRGKNFSTLTAVYFNGVKASVNPALTTNELTFVTIPENAPYASQNNIMTVQNLKGSTEYDFSLLTIEDFTEATLNGIKTVTLRGGDFSETSSVTFVSGTEEDGNLVENEAEILSVSETEVTVAVPDGVEQAFIYLETSRGAVTQSDSYGFSYSIYIDALNPDWTMSQWGGTFDLENTDPALGQFSIKSTREAWSGLSFLAPSIPFNDYEAITVSIYGTGDAGDSVNLAINDFAAQVNLVLVPNQWNKFVVPLSSFYPNGGAPATITRLDFQEASGTGKAQYIFYVDDFGLL